MNLQNKATMFVNELEDVAAHHDDKSAGTRVMIKYCKPLDEEQRKEFLKEASLIIHKRLTEKK